LTHLRDRIVEAMTVVSHNSWRNQNLTIKIGKEKLGPRLGTVKTNDAEVLRPNLLDTGMKHAARLAH
jgi:hypothetical protein